MKCQWCYLMQEWNTALISTILNKILVESIETAKAAALQLDYHPESHSHMIFFFYCCMALSEKNMVFPVR